MSIRAIDSQMMITRAADLSRDVSSELNKTTFRDEYQAVQSKLLQEKESNSVAKTDQIDKVEIQVNEDGHGSGAYEQGNNRKRKSAPIQEKQEEKKSDLQIDLGEKRTIDITV